MLLCKAIAFAALLVLSTPAQVFRLTPEQMAKYTPLNPYPRFADGRPKVDDAIL
jgi:hypothetical protein